MKASTHSAQISPKQWRWRGEFKTLLGHSIFVMDEGSRDLPTILLIHGFPTSSWDWQRMWHSLGKNYRLLALDMLGFGFSDKPDNRLSTIHRQADLVEALVEAKQLTHFHVLAHDYGDTVAQELLARQLEGSGAGQWLSCCLLNGGLFPETHRTLLTQKLLLSPVGSLLNRMSSYAQFSRNFSAVFGSKSKPSEEELQAFWTIINTNNGKHVLHNLITCIRDRKQYRERWVSALQHSTVPLGLINGSADPMSGAHVVTRYKELNCRCDYLAQLPSIGHYPHMEDPDNVQQHYQRFLASLS
jgi:pimeloyl-ACP methyl ester carboxylesterase